MQIAYIVHIWKEGRYFIAHALPLDVMSAGQTIEEARQALDEAVHLFLVTAADLATLEQVLEEAGYGYENGSWISPAWVARARPMSNVAAVLEFAGKWVGDDAEECLAAVYAMRQPVRW